MIEETMLIIRDASGAVINIGPWDYRLMILEEGGEPVVTNPLPEGSIEDEAIVVTGADGGRYVKGDYSAFPTLTARQLRLGLLAGDISPSAVTSALNAMPAGADKEKALIEWEFASIFQRSHPLISSVAAAVNLTDDQIDTMWMAAATL